MRTHVPGKMRPSVLFLAAATATLMACGTDAPTGIDSSSIHPIPPSEGAASCDLNYAVGLDGSSGRVGLDATLLGAPASVTVEARLRLTDTDRLQIVVTNAQDDFNDGFTLMVTPANLPAFLVALNVSRKASVKGTEPLEPGRWYELSAIYDADAGELRLWVDGVQVGSAEFADGINYKSGRDLRFGMQVKSLSRSERFFGGTLDEVRIWSVARDAGAVAAGMNGSVNGGTEGLAGYWPMNEGTGTNTADGSQTENDGELQGGTSWTEGACMAPQIRIVSIDVKPGDEGASPIRMNPGLIPVAVLGASDFDVADLYPASLTFGATGDEESLNTLPGGHPHCAPEDVNRDGHADLVCHFRAPLTGLVPGVTEAVLKGMMVGDVPVEGNEDVRVL